jgi:hypothetical protein
METSPVRVHDFLLAFSGHQKEFKEEFLFRITLPE